jgi:hypothetical protein
MACTDATQSWARSRPARGWQSKVSQSAGLEFAFQATILSPYALPIGEREHQHRALCIVVIAVARSKATLLAYGYKREPN